MSTQEIILGVGSGGLAVVVLTLIQISPLKINPWTLLAKFLKWGAKMIGKAFNGAVIEKVDGVSKTVDTLKTDLETFKARYDEDKAVSSRTQILRFGDEILHDVRHSKEHFDQILLVIDSYEEYCRDHKEFQNNIAVATIRRIKQVYDKCMSENSFL